MQDYGHIRISRKAFFPVESGGDVFWNEKRRLSRWEAWMYLISEAAWADHDYAIKGGSVIRLQRGETRPLSVRHLMAEWGWGSKKSVSAFLDEIRSRSQIRVQQRTPKGDTYFLVNYDKYHGSGDTDGDRGRGQPGDSNGDSDGDNREERKEREEDRGSENRNRKTTRATQLPDDFEPTDTEKQLARDLGLSLDDELPRFRDHAKATGRTLKDWHAGLRTWLRKAKDFNGSRRTAHEGYDLDAVIGRRAS